jgi:hypothetical protein
MTFTSLIPFCAAKGCPLKNSFRRMALLQCKKVIAICQMTAKSDKKSNISTCLEMIKVAKVQNAEVSILPSNNIMCTCVEHNAVCVEILHREY